MSNKMRVAVSVAGVVCVLLALALWTREGKAPATSGEDQEPAFVTIEAARHIMIHCGNSMRPVAERLGKQFQDEQGIAVRFNYGGSPELLSAIELGNQGDLYICHDPYAARLDEKGLLERAVAVGHLEPVLIVPSGNPQGIHALEDLARPGLRIGLPDPRFSTAGEMVAGALVDRDLEASVRPNVRLETRGHNELALAVTAGHIEAAVAWNFIAAHYKGQVEPLPTGVDFPEIAVTICLLTHTQDREAAELFMEMAASPEGRQVFREMGYARSGAESESGGGRDDLPQE